MKTTEKILAVIAIVGIIMKGLIITGRGLALMIGFAGLAILYMYFFSFAFFNDIRLRDIFKKQSYKGRSAVRIIGTIVLGFSLAVSLLGIFFNFQAYPGATLMLIEGTVYLAICLITVAILATALRKQILYKKLISRSAIVGGFALILYLTPNVLFFQFRHHNNPAYVEAYKNLNDDPNNKEYQDEYAKQKQLDENK